MKPYLLPYRLKKRRKGASATGKLKPILLACLAALCLTGCDKQIEFTWAMERVPNNLDPQLVWESPELIAVTNLYSGLYRLDEGGEPVPDCAESCTVSDDGLTYTFTLKEGLGYTQNRGEAAEYELTAGDFVFALRRVFRAETGSPYTDTYASIKNSAAVLAGSMDESALGVSAPDGRTVVIELSRPDPQLLYKLALPGAMPCNEEFFESTEGTYGLTRATTMGNGSFYVYNWNDNGLFLRRPASGDAVTALRLVINATGESAASSGSSSAASAETLWGEALVREGEATAALSETLSADGLDAIPYTATTWVLLFNCGDETLAQPLVRQALAASAQNAAVSLPDGFAEADGLVPPAVTVQGENYREAAGSVRPAFGSAAELCRQGLAALGATRFEDIALLAPEGESYLQLAQGVNQQWQKDLGAFAAYFPVKQLPLEQLTAQVEAGDYQVALLPLSPASDSAAELLGRTAGLAGWQDAGWQQQLQALYADGSHTAAQAAAAERALLESACAAPLWFQTKALLMQPGVEGLVFRPFGPVLDLTGATMSQ